MFKHVVACVGLTAVAYVGAADSQQSSPVPNTQSLRIGATMSLTGRLTHYKAVTVVRATFYARNTLTQRAESSAETSSS
jgi:hypothetical protein